MLSYRDTRDKGGKVVYQLLLLGLGVNVPYVEAGITMELGETVVVRVRESERGCCIILGVAFPPSENGAPWLVVVRHSDVKLWILVPNPHALLSTELHYPNRTIILFLLIGREATPPVCCTALGSL